ncbi:aminoglycoside phosphotransferase family protein [Streptomyces sp. NPDC048644]|uniref:aminoglycoside phosphotransferase family protein n=1 Tax=Streptomyces sp. NPDC048644 TaxID=3365582 RepID=UPI00371AE79F
MSTTLLARLAALSSAPGPGPVAAAPVPPPAPEAPASPETPASPPAPEVLADRPDGTVVRSGRRVAKAHDPACAPRDLAARLRVAAHPRLHGILLTPLPVTAPDGFLTRTDDGRLLTRWPYGSPVPPDDPDAAPWEDAARLLAALHSVDPRQLPAPVPPMRGPAKAARAMARMRAATTGGPLPAPLRAASGAVERAWALLPPWARAATAGPPRPADRPALLCHGDLHLGQLVRHPAATGPWLLIDIDDLGLGDPAWDLARPAAWFATGLLAPDIWSRFLAAYRAAGGPAVPPGDDPWPALEPAARALTVQTAALAVAKAAAAPRLLDDIETAVLDACARMAPVPPDADGSGPERPPHRGSSRRPDAS